MRAQMMTAAVFGQLCLGTLADAAPRIYLSPRGSNSNSCATVSRPCKTLSAAVRKADPGGTVIVLASGSFGGAGIDKSVTIQAPPGVVALVEAITIDAGPEDVVVFRGLTSRAPVTGEGLGIRFNSGAALHLEASVIEGWAFGVYVLSAGGRFFISDTAVRDCWSSGVALNSDLFSANVVEVVIKGSRFENNGKASTTSCGVTASRNVHVTVSDSVAAGNPSGLCALLAGAELTVQGSVVTHNLNNGIHCEVGDGEKVRVSHSTIVGNGWGLHQEGTCTFESLGNNLVRGNSLGDVEGVVTVVAPR